MEQQVFPQIISWQNFKIEKDRFYILPFVDFNNIDYIQIVTLNNVFTHFNYLTLLFNLIFSSFQYKYICRYIKYKYNFLYNFSFEFYLFLFYHYHYLFYLLAFFFMELCLIFF